VFENVLDAAARSGSQRLPKSLSVSAALHCAAALGLFIVHFSPAVRDMSLYRQPVILITPALSSPPKVARPRVKPLPRVVAPVVSPLVSRAVPRTFRALPVLPTPPVSKIAPELPPAPVVETPRPQPAAPELPRIATAPAPPLKTDNLAASQPAVPVPTPQLAVQAGGFSGAEISTSRAARGALSSNPGFGNAAADSTRRNPAVAVSKGGFNDASVAAPARSPTLPATASPALTPVEILFKPRPLYTEEARRLQIEGEVLVELLFPASGDPRVLRVIRGLGHGLDETAVRAAQAIRFRPAQRAGMPVDSSAAVHILFQLAY
jgi:TonB family protein